MPRLTVSPANRVLLQQMDTDLGKALGFGVDDGTTEFIDEMVNYELKLSTADKLKAREFLTAAAAAMITAGIIGSGTTGVTNIATGNGLSGGPITTTGTIDLRLLSGGGLSKTLGGGSNELGVDTAVVATLTGSQTLTNKTISGVSNTLTNIGNVSLVNSSLTVSAGSGLSGGGTISLGGSTSLSIAAGGVSNAMLTNSSLTVTAGAGLTGGGAISLGGSGTLDVGAGTGIVVNANDVAVDTAVVATTTNTLTMSNKTLSSPTLTGTITLSGMTQGSVLFAGASGVLTQDNANFFYDDTNNRLGLGITTPGVIASIDITGSLAHLKSTTEHAGLIIETSITSGKDPFLLFYSSAVDLDSAVFLDDSDGNKLKFAMGVINTDANRNTNTKMVLAQDGSLSLVGSTAAVGASGYGALRYNSSTNLFQVSKNAAAYQDLISGTLTAGRVPYTSAAGVLADNSVFTWDNTNARLGVGATTPALALDVQSSAGPQVKVKCTNASNVTGIDLYSSGDVFKLEMGYSNSGADAYLYGASSTDFSIQVNAGATKHIFKSGGQVGLGYVSAGSTTIGQHRAVIFQDVTYPSDVTASQLALCGTTDPTKIMSIGVDTSTTNGYGFIAVGKQGVQWTTLTLQPSGGNVGIGTGTTAPGATLDLKDASAGNLCSLNMQAGQSASVSSSSMGRLRYNASTNAFQASENTGAYQDIVLLSKTQTLTGKTLSAGTIAGATSVTGQITFSAFPAPNYAGTSTNVIAPTWTNVTYSNSYVDYGGAYGGSQYYKDGHGMVHLRIAAKNGTSGAVMFTLPAGFRPGSQYLYWAGIDNAVGNILITTGGAVSSTGGNIYCIMGEVVFSAEA